MPVIKMKPTSPGTRTVVKLDKSHLYKGGPYEPLTVEAEAQVRPQQRGPHHHAPPGRWFGTTSTASSTSSATRTASPAWSSASSTTRTAPATSRWIKYADGERRYIIATKGMAAGDEIRSGADSPIKSGNAMQLRHVPVGSIVHNVELKPGKGGQLARSAGSSVTYTAREGIYATLRLKSGETRKVHIDCRATIGEVSNDEHNLHRYGKAGAKRWRGIRPTVRGLAMNPVDHPHGGGEGKSGQGNPHPVSAVGLEHQGSEDPPQQAHEQHDRAASPEQGSLKDLPCRVH